MPLPKGVGTSRVLIARPAPPVQLTAIFNDLGEPVFNDLGEGLTGP